MRSLLRLLKYKALSSVNTRRTQEESSQLDRSPFAAGPTYVEYIESTTAEAVSCQSFKLNALADLAQRVSSSGEQYDVTPASVFLSETAECDLKLQQEVADPILLTPWPFTSFSQPGDDEDTEPKHPWNGGFEFTVPKPISTKDVEEPASTLFKWGTMDSVRDAYQTEADYNNSEEHHYDTWAEGKMTPFDKPAIPIAFTREDSAQQNQSTNYATLHQDKNGLTLPLLERSIKNAKPGSVLDLGGLHIIGDGSLLITTSDITLQNGTLELTQGLSISACRVNLHDLTLISKSSRAATLRVSKKDSCVRRCDITNSEGVGIQVTGLGSTLTMRQTKVHHCERSCVCVNRAGILKIEEGCIIQGSRSFHGISATDAGTELWIENARIIDNFQDGIYVTSSAHAALENCEISGSHNFHGIAGKKFGTTIVLKNCQLQGFKESAVIVEMGAKAKITECTVRKCTNGHGVVADGHGSYVDVLDCEISDCDVGGAFIRGNASSKFTRTHIFGSAYGNGVVVSEQGSFLRLINCVIFQNCRNGVLVMDEAKINLEDCDVSASTAGNGILIRDQGSQGILNTCRLSKNYLANLCVDAGAICHVAHCHFDKARNGPSVIGRGSRTLIEISTDEATAVELQRDIYILSRAKIHLNERKCRNRSKWPNMKPQYVFSRKFPFDLERHR